MSHVIPVSSPLEIFFFSLQLFTNAFKRKLALYFLTPRNVKKADIDLTSRFRNFFGSVQIADKFLSGFFDDRALAIISKMKRHSKMSDIVFGKAYRRLTV